MVRMPSEASFSLAFGPMPLILLAGSGQIRAAMSATVMMVRPFGFSNSEHSFESNLLGLMPIEQVRPVALCTADLIRSAMSRTPACGSTSLVS